MRGLSSQKSITKFSISPNLPQVFANENETLKDPFKLTLIVIWLNTKVHKAIAKATDPAQNSLHI